MPASARYDEERATQKRARLVGLDYVDTSQMPNKQLYKGILSNDEMRSLHAIPLRADEHHILFGITTNTSQDTITSLSQRFTDQMVNFTIISDTGFHDYMLLYDPPEKVIYHDINLNAESREAEDIDGGSEKPDNSKLIEEVSSTLESVRADDMLAYLVSQAHKLNSSDIHCENQQENVRIRLRIDGVLHPIAELTKDKFRILLAAVASAGDISTSSEEAQQGHISQHVKMADGNMVDVNIRLETVPTINGTDIVMRLFNMDSTMYRLDKLGLSERERTVIDDVIAKPSGLVMVVGPTGSGKTTTLYSMLNTMISDERKIITVEDPVEYQFPGITQIPIKSTEKGNDGGFAGKLRAILRLDPDVVMVGEIRDMDTAQTALQAALTGHLVLATFHAGSAAAALTRLMDVIGQNPLFVSAIRLVMAQRLVRKLDDSTKQPYEPTEAERKKIVDVINSLPEGVEKPDIDNLQLFQPGESPENPYGYTGQIAVREQFTMNGPIRDILENPTKVLSSEDIEASAVKSGMLTMVQDGIIKVCAGQTTLNELFRVVG